MEKKKETPMRFRYILALILVAGSLAAQTAPPAKPAAAAKPVDVAGVWEMTLQGTPQGDMTSDATFVQDNDKIKFTSAGPGGFEMTGEGTVKGQDLEWTVTISTPQGEFALTYKGKVEGETMTGEVIAGRLRHLPLHRQEEEIACAPRPARPGFLFRSRRRVYNTASLPELIPGGLR